MNQTPFFIVSSGRAGSTLLATMLNNSDEVFVPPESDFIARAYPFFHGKTRFTRDDLKVAVDMFMCTSQGRGWGMDAHTLVAALEREEPRSFADMNLTIYRTYCNDRQLRHVWCGIKRPMLIASINRIVSVFPETRIVHILRDGRDVHLSFLDAHKKGVPFGPKSVFSAALYWVDGLRRFRTFKHDKQIHMRYEDLVAEPEHEMKRLCEFLQIAYTPNLLRAGHQQSGKKNIIQEEHRHTVHQKISEQIDGQNVSKYISRMNRGSIAMFDGLAAPYLIRYGYPTTLLLPIRLLLVPFQLVLYTLARAFNSWRYRKRERQLYQDCRNRIESKGEE